jgi:hypothetical protein
MLVGSSLRRGAAKALCARSMATGEWLLLLLRLNALLGVCGDVGPARAGRIPPLTR